MIKSVISDLGNVIIFFDNHIFFKKISDYCPFSAEEIAGAVLDHLDIIRSFDTGKLTSNEFYAKAKKILKAEIEYYPFFSIYNDVFSLNSPILEILKRLKPRYKLLLLSNTDAMRFGFVRRKFPEILIFDDYVLSYEVGHLKPHPRIYDVAIEKSQVKADECLFIDDREENIEAATRLGMKVIHFGPQTGLEAELREHGLSF